MGVIVDSVSEVTTIGTEHLADIPTLGSSVDLSYVHGMAKVGDKIKILLNTSQFLRTDAAEFELAEVAEQAEELEVTAQESTE